MIDWDGKDLHVDDDEGALATIRNNRAGKRCWAACQEYRSPAYVPSFSGSGLEFLEAEGSGF